MKTHRLGSLNDKYYLTTQETGSLKPKSERGVSYFVDSQGNSDSPSS